MAAQMILNEIRNAKTCAKAEDLAGISIDCVLNCLDANQISFGQAIRSIRAYRDAVNERHDRPKFFSVVET